jgi:hypothetical protein
MLPYLPLQPYRHSVHRNTMENNVITSSYKHFWLTHTGQRVNAHKRYSKNTVEASSVIIPTIHGTSCQSLSWTLHSSPQHIPTDHLDHRRLHQWGNDCEWHTLKEWSQSITANLKAPLFANFRFSREQSFALLSAIPEEHLASSPTDTCRYSKRSFIHCFE